MATTQEIMKAALFCYKSRNRSGCFVLTPPVRALFLNRCHLVGICMVNPTEETVALVGAKGFFQASDFTIHKKQGFIKGDPIPENLWNELQELLNRVANEISQDSDGPGSEPTYNARMARDMLDKLWMRRSIAL